MNRVLMFLCLLSFNFGAATAHAEDPPTKTPVKPLKALLVTGGCCHDYAKQKDVLKKGIEDRAHVVVELMHSDDKSTKCKFEAYTKADWASGYDVIIHDECSADANDFPYVEGIVAPHKAGLPGVNLHCAMHSYRVSPDFRKPSIKPGTRDTIWFDYIGLQSTGHGPQSPIELTYLPTNHPITKGSGDWKTINEELYNNIQIFDTATPLIRGKQGKADKEGVNNTVVAWTNLYGPKKTRVFSTSLGHNTETVADDRYLNLVTRGMLWACDKLSDEYLKPFDAEKAKAESDAKEKTAPKPTPATKADAGDKKNSPQETKTTTAAAKAARPVGDLVKVPSGFEATLFAGPPDVNYPTCLSATPDGVLYVGCDENGSIDAKPGRGRIVRCIDRDGDGVSDDFKVVVKVESPRGVIEDKNALYVLHPPRLSAFIDDQGNGDFQREEVLVEGIGRDLKFRGADHTTNGIRLGIDGYIYVAVGDYGFMEAQGKDEKKLQLHGGGVVRVRTDGTGLELVSRGQRNIYDVAIDPQMNIFTRDNTNDGGGWDVRLSHVVPHAQFGYPSLYKRFGEEIIPPLLDSGGGSPTGSLFVDEGALPEGFRQMLLTCEWGRSQLQRHPMEPKGATFQQVKHEPFVSLPRPTDVEIDANGRIYVASWKDGEFRYSGPNVGFVACVRATGGAKPTNVSTREKATDAQLVEWIGSASHSLRVSAQREILQRGKKPEFTSGLKKIVSRDGDLAPRVAAIFTLSQLLREEAYPDVVAWAKHDELREFALMALSDRNEQPEKIPSEPFVSALNDINPRVRLRAVAGMARFASAEALEKIVPLTGDADPIVAHVTINALADRRAGVACLRGLDGGTSAVRAGILRALQQIHEPAVVDGLAERFAKATDNEYRQGILRALMRLTLREADWDSKWWGTRPDTTGPYFRAVAWEKSDEIKALLGKAFETADESLAMWMIREARKYRIELPKATAQILRLAKSEPSFKVDGAVILASTAAADDETIRVIAEVAQDLKQTVDIRAQLIQDLIRKNQSRAARDGAWAAMSKVGLAAKDGRLRQLRNDFLNALGQPNRTDEILEFYQGGTPPDRELALAALIKIGQQPKIPPESRQAIDRLLNSAWAKPDTAASFLRAIAATNADEFSQQVLSFIDHKEPAIRDAARFAAGELRLDQQDKNKVTIQSLPYEKVFEDAQKEKGDAKLGAKLFVRQGCANCHTTDPGESPKGPFLGGISARYKRTELTESILKPSAKVAQGFETQILALHDGTQWMGFVSRESGDEVELRSQNGVVTILKKDDIEARKKSEVSTMPNGLVDRLSVQELQAILAYLESLPAK